MSPHRLLPWNVALEMLVVSLQAPCSCCLNVSGDEAGPSDKYGHCSLCTCDRHPAVGMAKGVTLAFKWFLVL